MQNHTDNRVYAGFFVRFIAYIIDSLIALIVSGIVRVPFSVAASAGLSALKSNFIFQHSFLDVVGYIGLVGYFVLITYLTHTTFGKMLMRLEVVTADGECTFINILYRETVGRFLSGILNIGYLAVIISEKKQGFHDMLCDTYVVYKDMKYAVVSPVTASPYVGNVQTPEQRVEQRNIAGANETFVMDRRNQGLTGGDSVIINEPEKVQIGTYDNMNPDCSNLPIESAKD